jgi:hypothetical protein
MWAQQQQQQSCRPPGDQLQRRHRAPLVLLAPQPAAAPAAAAAPVPAAPRACCAPLTAAGAAPRACCCWWGPAGGRARRLAAAAVAACELPGSSEQQRCPESAQHQHNALLVTFLRRLLCSFTKAHSDSIIPTLEVNSITVKHSSPQAQHHAAAAAPEAPAGMNPAPTPLLHSQQTPAFLTSTPQLLLLLHQGHPLSAAHQQQLQGGSKQQQ